MPQFAYIALDPSGVELRGEIEALDEREARTRLKGQQVRLLLYGNYIKGYEVEP